MKKFLSTLLLIAVLSPVAMGQLLTQTIRGRVVDADSKAPLPGVIVKVMNTASGVGTATDQEGDFRLQNAPTGRVSLQVAYPGYETKVISDLEVTSGKEKIVNIGLQEAIVKLAEVVVSASNKEKGDALNDMSLISTRAISLEETKRYAGSFNDPARVLTNFAGVTNTQTGENDIIVRGNSPKYVQWRMEGIEIANPTHFADQNAVRGGISALNNSLLATSDFSTGAFAPEYGNALSGVYDVKLRAGNNEKRESSFGIGLLGTDLTLEGPFKKGYGGSYLINYRYSTISLINDLGLIDIDGALNFQDMAFKVRLPTTKMGEFSLFGLGGISSFSVKDIKYDFIQTPGNATKPRGLKKDYDKANFLSNFGANHTLNLGNRSFISTTLAFSSSGLKENTFDTKTTKIFNQDGEFLRDSVGNSLLGNKSNLTKSVYSAAITYNNKISPKSTLQIGTKYFLFGYDYDLSGLQDSTNARFTSVDLNKYIGTLRNFISFKHRLNERITVVTGVHNTNVIFNKKYAVEPRFAVKWVLTPTSSLNAGYGKHTTMESVHNYFTKVRQADGSVGEPNKDLDLLKAHHYVLGYEKRFSENLRVKAEVYYQHLYDLPVENVDTSYYATLNEGIDIKYLDLVNKGTGKNYGVELTVERFFANSYYFLLNGSLYESKYKSLEGVERNTLYNGKYLVNLLCGKEYSRWGKKQNQSLALNVKAFFGGGQPYIPLLRNQQGQLAVDPQNDRFWDYRRSYNHRLDNVYQITLSANYKWDRPNATHELFINLDNLTNTQSRLSEYYDPNKPGSVGYVRQFGLFPNLLYRAYF